MMTCAIAAFFAFAPSCDAGNFAETFKSENRAVAFGMSFGAVDQIGKHFGAPFIGCSVTAMGVYADGGFWPRHHAQDVRVDEWDDEQVWSFHLGYQVPLTKWLRVTPIVGYYDHKSGTTDGSNWRADGYGIHNSFDVTDHYSGVDYGGRVTLNFGMLNVDATMTKNEWSVGVGLEIKIPND